MRRDFTRRIKSLSSLWALLLLLLFMIPRNDPSESVRRSLIFCAGSLVPSLFLSSVLGKMLASGIKLRTKYADIVIILYSMLCGFPFGAITAGELYKNGSISRDRAEKITAFSNTASASFIVSYVGVSSLGNVRAGLFLLAGNTLVTLMWYLVLRMSAPKEQDIFIMNVSHSKNIVSAVAESSQTMLAVCGCVVFFSSVCDLLCRSVANDVIKTMIRGFFEISGGIKDASGLKPGVSYILSAIFIGWSGLSVMFQVAFASGSDIRTRCFVLGRIFQASAMGVFAVLTKKYVI